MHVDVPLLRPLALLPLLLLAGCASDGDPSEDTPSMKKGDESAREIELLELDLQAKRLSGQKSLHGAELAVVEARVALEEARKSLAEFGESGRGLQLDKKRIELDRAKGRASDAEAELAELEAMYAEEEFAELTKELVLARGRRSLELAQRDLDVKQRELVQLEGAELPRKERELAEKVRAAEGVLSKAELGLEVSRVEAQADVARAEKALMEKREKTAKKGDEE